MIDQSFSGRQLPGGPEPKYRNSPATEIYKKDQTLYGLNWAKRNFAKEDRIIICEGQLDVIAFHESKLPIAVAPCGTAITENHIKTLANYSKNIIICFDSDAAGQNAQKNLFNGNKSIISKSKSQLFLKQKTQETFNE